MKRPIFLAIALVALAASAPTIAQERLGRLFFTPEERTAMDRGRAISATTTRNTVDTSPKEMSIDGRITRSDGSTTTWIDGEPRFGSSKTAPGKDARVGETVDLKSGQRRDHLQGGRIEIKPSQP